MARPDVGSVSPGGRGASSVFPAPFSPQKARDDAGLQLETDVVDGKDGPEPLDEVVDCDSGHVAQTTHGGSRRHRPARAFFYAGRRRPPRRWDGCLRPNVNDTVDGMNLPVRSFVADIVIAVVASALALVTLIVEPSASAVLSLVVGASLAFRRRAPRPAAAVAMSLGVV